MERREIASVVLRFGMAIIFLYFGFSQVVSPDAWNSYVPSFLSNGVMTANNLVMINGILEITLGIFLIIGLYIKFSAIILSIHLLFIAFSMGINPTAVRDLGLAIATFVVFLNGKDSLTFDSKKN
jgi:uncharacterized membrane protein YphA (DoxX/SURF4 family)